jgi:hypothetical protein
MSNPCCSDTDELHSTNGGVLDDCFAKIGILDSCNFDSGSGGECTVDFRTSGCYQCEDDYIKNMCQQLGGKVIEGDYSTTCSYFGEEYTVNMTTFINCMAPSCSEEEFIEIGLFNEEYGLEGVDCTVVGASSGLESFSGLETPSTWVIVLLAAACCTTLLLN